MGDRPLCHSPIVVTEDSVLLSRMINDSLERAGFTEIKFSNGQEAWNYLSSIRNDSDLYEKVNLIITDIEMPEMDEQLTKLNQDEYLKKLRVVIFSSLVNEQMRQKGKELGADEQLSKPEIGHLVAVMDELLAKFYRERNAGHREMKRYEMTPARTGNEMIDSEHQRIFDEANAPLEACQAGQAT